MIPGNYEAFYFDEKEFGNPENLRDVLEGLGEPVDKSVSLKSTIVNIVDEFGYDTDDVESRSFYGFEDGSRGCFYKLDEGIVIACDSDYFSENSRSVTTRGNDQI